MLALASLGNEKDVGKGGTAGASFVPKRSRSSDDDEVDFALTRSMALVIDRVTLCLVVAPRAGLGVSGGVSGAGRHGYACRGGDESGRCVSHQT